VQTGVIRRPEIPYDTEDTVMISQINDEMQSIERMTVVGRLYFIPPGTSPAGFQANLKCRGTRDQGSCGKKLLGPVRLNLTSRGTLLDCLKDLHRKLETDHSKCVSCVAADTSQEPAPMIINSSQLRAAGFKLDKVIPPQLEAAARR